MHREDNEYCEFIYECLYEESMAMFNDLSDAEFKKLIRKQYKYIKKIAKEGFIKKQASQGFKIEAYFFQYSMCSIAYPFDNCVVTSIKSYDYVFCACNLWY